MRAYNRYILFLALLLLSTTIVLSVAGETRLDLYLTIYIIESLVLNELYAYLNPNARRGLNRVSYMFFVGFPLIVALNVAEIFWGIEIL